MPYRVLVVTSSGVRYLRYGRFVKNKKLGTRFDHPTAAKMSIEGAARRRAEQYVFVIEYSDGQREEYVPRAYNQLQLTVKVTQIDGGFRVYAREASCEMVTDDLPETMARIARDWAEQVLCDL